MSALALLSAAIVVAGWRVAPVGPAPRPLGPAVVSTDRPRAPFERLGEVLRRLGGRPPE